MADSSAVGTYEASLINRFDVWNRSTPSRYGLKAWTSSTTSLYWSSIQPSETGMSESPSSMMYR